MRGIGGYGNCVGVPTVGGEVNFHPAYNGNPLVNAMTVGIAPRDRIFLSAAAGIGNPVVYVGSRTGRDGIHGATMASAEFGADSESKRPTVQVGDPFTEKLLIEACLELMATDAIVAIQDMGAAGLTSSAVEMAGKGGVGIELDLDAVPQRETGMTAYEMMLSESQERMLMVLRPDRQAMARAIFEKWELDFAVIGHLTDTGRIVIRHQGRVEADIPLDPLADRRRSTPPDRADAAAGPARPGDQPARRDRGADHADRLPRSVLARLGVGPVRQHDRRPDGQAPGRRGRRDRAHRGPPLALALTTDCTPRYCAADPRTGGMQAVAEAWRNITATGATPLAITDNMNFGNPEKPLVMGQFAAAVRGHLGRVHGARLPRRERQRQPVQRDGRRPILPTPAIGGLGVIADAAQAVGLALRPALELVVVGRTAGWLGQSLWLREVAGPRGRPAAAGGPGRRAPQRRLRPGADRRRAGRRVPRRVGRRAAGRGGGDGAGRRCGRASRPAAAGTDEHAWWFGEDQGRYVLAVTDAAALMLAADAADVPVLRLGAAMGSRITLADGSFVELERYGPLTSDFSLPGWSRMPATLAA